VGCEDGWIPLGRETGVEGDEDEERRLLYVAMTRARQRLYLSWSRSRTLYGRRRQRKFSPLLARVDPRILLQEALAEQRPRKPRQLQLF
jgi:DNA helicase-2/ATP-dependent DNA helicase PcrA